MSARVPVPVEIVRPRRTVTEAVAALVGVFGEWFISAAVLMVLIPGFAPWHPSYSHAFALVVAVRVALPADTSWLRWTRASMTKRAKP